MATRLSGGTWDFLNLSFHMFPYNKILKVFKSKIWVDIWRKHLQNFPKCKISAKSVTGFGSYEYLKFRPMYHLKYRLWRHNYVIVVTPQMFCYHCVEYVNFDICAKFHNHQSCNNKKWWGGALMLPPHDWRFKKSPCQIGLNYLQPLSIQYYFVSLWIHWVIWRSTESCVGLTVL